jgi:hypothetical protein
MASGFRVGFAKKSRLDQCLQGFVCFLGKIFALKKPRAVRVWFWVLDGDGPRPPEPEPVLGTNPHQVEEDEDETPEE